MRILRQSSALLLLHVATGGLFGRVDLVGIVDTVVVALIGFGRVEACLCQSRLELRQCRKPCATLDGTYLDEVLALGLRDKRLELRRSKRVDKTRL